MNLLWSGRTVEAISRPPAKLKKTSVAIKVKVLFERRPNLFSSVFKWGFQWGRRSRAKWLARAKGSESAGLPILAAIAAPTIVCGNSSTLNLIIYSYCVDVNVGKYIF